MHKRPTLGWNLGSFGVADDRLIDDRLIDGWIDRLIDRLIDGWIDRLIDGLID